MTDNYKKGLNILKAVKMGTETKSIKIPMSKAAKVVPFSGFSENTEKHYSKRTKQGKDPIADVKYTKYRRTSYSHD